MCAFSRVFVKCCMCTSVAAPRIQRFGPSHRLPAAGEDGLPHQQLYMPPEHYMGYGGSVPSPPAMMYPFPAFSAALAMPHHRMLGPHGAVFNPYSGAPMHGVVIQGLGGPNFVLFQ